MAINLDSYLKKEYGCKVYKLALDAGCTCPNRDGKISTGGCIFCSEGGSGDFAERVLTPEELPAALERAKARVAGKLKGAKEVKYIPYFQSYTNTYGDLERLESIFTAAAKEPDVAAISIATRPDCVGEDVIKMLSRLKAIKPVWVELGLQTMHERTAKIINRGFSLDVYEKAYKDLTNLGITVITHLIVGLPGETLEDMRETVKYVSALNPTPAGIKIALLHVIKGTALCDIYERGEANIHEFTLEEYASFIGELVSLLPADTVVHRLTGDAPKKLLVYPAWTADKKRVINALNGAIITCYDF
ncbi:MAG: TIGR01212 family radical SAM protein [Lachnospiraceae bacterium]|nr:TIGR01212 family radical SAM protein [Lachnospiraceae bacterium]